MIAKACLWLCRCLLLVASGYSALSFGTSLQELQKAGHVSIQSELIPNTAIVPGQRVALNLTVATDSWFTGGTRIDIPEVPGLVILQTEQFASNASEIRNGTSWVLQRWTLDVFPQRAGDFTIGPVSLQVQVDAGAAGAVSGALSSSPVQFTVAVPESLAVAEHWVAAPEFRVDQTFDRPLQALRVGDAFEQQVVFEAADVMAMMLPSYSVTSQPGLAAYPAPPTLENSTNRGQTLARRSTVISYVIEQPGNYVLPATDYYWWDTTKSRLQLLSLPETRFEVTGAATAAEPSQRATYFISPQQWLALGASVVLIIIAIYLATTLLPRLPLSRWRMQLARQIRRLRGLFKPALATQLNPGSNAEQ
jgi:hypothetical protein